MLLLQLKLKLGETILPWLSCNQTDYFENSLKTKSLVPWAIWTATPPVRRKKKRNFGGNISLCSLPGKAFLEKGPPVKAVNDSTASRKINSVW